MRPRRVRQLFGGVANEKTNSIDSTASKGYSLGGLDGGRGGHDHEYTVNQYRGDDEEGKERVNQYVNGHTSYRVERVEDPHRVRR